MILGFTFFGWWPIIKGVMLSFQETNYISSTWVGLDNFSTVLSDPLLAQAFQNTLYFAAVAILIGFPVPLILAGTISELKRTRQFASILAFLPVVIPPVVAILLFKRFYSPSETGIINTIVGWVGLGPVEWLQNPATAMTSLVIAATWAGMGSTVIIYLAAMTMIDRELYDAAEVDGASILGRIWHVTLPQLRLTILIMLLLQIIGVWQVFTEPYLLTNGGGPNGASASPVLIMVQKGIDQGNPDVASAIGVILVIGVLVISLINRRLLERD